MSIPPFGRGFSRHRVYRSDVVSLRSAEASRRAPFIVSMSPPDYPSAWLRPRSARFRFARQNHCSAAATSVANFRMRRPSAIRSTANVSGIGEVYEARDTTRPPHQSLPMASRTFAAI